MAMTYQESADLMNDSQFRGRIKVGALGYATYILGEAPGVTAHNSRYKWAQTAYQSPDAVAVQLHPAVVMEDRVQSQGAAINDTDLRASIETVVNRMI